MNNPRMDLLTMQFDDLEHYLPGLKVLAEEMVGKGWKARDLVETIQGIEQGGWLKRREVLTEISATLADTDAISSPPSHPTGTAIDTSWKNVAKYMQLVQLRDTVREKGYTLDSYDRDEAEEKREEVETRILGTVHSLLEVRIGEEQGTETQEPEIDLLFPYLVPVGNIHECEAEVYFRADVYWDQEQGEPLIRDQLVGREAYEIVDLSSPASPVFVTTGISSSFFDVELIPGVFTNGPSGKFQSFTHPKYKQGRDFSTYMVDGKHKAKNLGVHLWVLAGSIELAKRF